MEAEYCSQIPKDKQPALRVIAMPSDMNHTGDIFGGWVMAQVDLAGSVEAVRVARGRVATVAVHEFVFKKPVYTGDLISCYADLEKIGNTSVTIKVTVYAQRSKDFGECVKVTEARVVYVALDGEGRPRVIPR